MLTRPKDCRGGVILGTPLGILGTVLGPRPLFLLGHHSWSPGKIRLFPPRAHTGTREMQKAGRHTTEGKSIAHNPTPEKGLPWICSNPCSKSLGPTGTETGTETKDVQVKGEERHTGSMCQEMQELPGKDAGKGNPGEAELVTLRLPGVWSGDQQPWAGREEAEVQRRPLERSGTGTPVWDNSEWHRSQATGASIT